MSNPQKENGYTAIANEILDQLIKTPIGKSDSQILFAIIRKTYGWNKKSDDISISQLMEMTKCSRRMVIYAIQNLEAKRMILIQRKRGRGNINEINHIAFNKNYSEWVVQEKSKQYDNVLKSRKNLYKKSKQKVVQEIEGSARNGQWVVQETENNGRFLAPTKDTTTKDNIQKTFFSSDSIEIELSTLLFQLIKENDPNFKPNFKQSDFKRWAVHIDRLIRLDNRSPETIRDVIEWCQSDSFWQGNILSTSKLREKFSQLYVKMPKHKHLSSKTQGNVKALQEAMDELRAEAEMKGE